MSDFSPKRVGETEIFTVDFSPLLATGETIISAAWTNSVMQGTDNNPGAMIQGAASINGAQVSTKIATGQPNAFYAPICTAITSLGQTLIAPEYGSGILHVTP